MLPEFVLPAEPICEECHFSLLGDSVARPYGEFVITNSMVIMFVVMAFMLLVALAVRNRIGIIPSGLQSIIEVTYDQIGAATRSALGRFTDPRLPLLMGFFTFILLANWFSLLPFVGTIGYFHEHHGHEVLVPFLRPATADINMTLALALVAFILIHSTGIAAHGLTGHLKEVAQNSWLLAPIFVLIELFVIVSLSFRLFGNLFAGEVLLGLSATYMPVIGVIFLLLELLFGLIQALVFAILTLSFTGVAIGTDAEAEHH